MHHFRLVAAKGLALAWLCAASSAASAKDTVILFLGDSLTEGYGVPPEAAFPALIEADLKAAKKEVKVVNAGISGSTSASGPGRMKWHLKGAVKPDILVLALGANDGLRGLAVDALKKNLKAVIDLAKANQIRVLLVGMMMPANFGKAYTDAFAQVFPDVAKAEGVDLVPFLLDGVALDKSLNQADGIHPTAAGHKILAKTVEKYLEPMLSKP